jgi:hypothetical protein
MRVSDSNFGAGNISGGSPPPLIFTIRGASPNMVREATLSATHYQINTDHSFNRPHIGPGGVQTDLRTTGLTPDQVEEAIVRDLDAFWRGGGTVPSAGHVERSVTVRGYAISYRAFQLCPHVFAIGTYFMQ